MVIRFEVWPQNGFFKDIYLNPDFVISVSHQGEWVAEAKKHFHIAGVTLVTFSTQNKHGEAEFSMVLGSLDEVAARMNWKEANHAK